MASEPASTAPAAQPPALKAPVPLEPNAKPAPASVSAPKPADPIDKPPAGEIAQVPPQVPHVALLLPLGSPTFAKHAEAVRNGFLAAAKVDKGRGLPVRVYSAADDPRQTVEIYIKAMREGARVVVGPLTRTGVNAVADSSAALVPTLALNAPEGRALIAPEIYSLNLQVEAEARQVAQLAWRDGRRTVLTVNGDTPLLKRIHQAFVEEFTRLGGVHASEHAYTTNQDSLARIKRAANAPGVDVAFMALDVARARLMRPYLGALALYATSQVYPGNAGPLAGFDLAGVRFLDMPWLLQPDHAAVMAYPRADYREAIEFERFYALGIDAFRIAQALLSGKPDAELDGVTGKLSLGSDRSFSRSLTAAQFVDGKLTVRAAP